MRKVSPELEQDFDKIRKKYVRLTWLLFALQAAVSFMVRFVVRTTYVKIIFAVSFARQLILSCLLSLDTYRTPLSLQTPLQRSLVNVPSYLCTLFPDTYSVAVYFRIKRHVAKGQEEEAEDKSDSGSLPYGGIYVGDDESSLQAGKHQCVAFFVVVSIAAAAAPVFVAVAVKVVEGADHYCPCSWTSSAGEPGDKAEERSTDAEVAKNSQSHASSSRSSDKSSSKEMRCVLLALRSYSISCALDLMIVAAITAMPKFQGDLVALV